MKKKWDWKLLCIVVLLLFVIISLFFQPTNDAKNFPIGSYANPAVFSQPSVMPHSSIDQIVHTTDRIYILFEAHKGIMQAYDHAGNYRYRNLSQSWRRDNVGSSQSQSLQKQKDPGISQQKRFRSLYP